MERQLKPWESLQSPFNPNPITKLLVMGFLGISLVHPLHPFAEWGIVFLLSLFYLLNGDRKSAVQNAVIFALLCAFPGFPKLYALPIVLKMFLSVFYMLRLVYFPVASGRFLMKTSDVGSILASMDYLHIPQSISIPVAVMFRFFPSFAEERRNIAMAMKIRGIRTRNPLRYLEYVTVPLLIISSNIAEDIAKAAECKCIENPVPKTRYTTACLQPVDAVYALSMGGLMLLGWIVLR